MVGVNHGEEDASYALDPRAILSCANTHRLLYGNTNGNPERGRAHAQRPRRHHSYKIRAVTNAPTTIVTSP